MNIAWIRGSAWERLFLRWKKDSILPNKETLDVVASLRNARKILIAPNDRVGGLFMGAPVYKALREHYPDSEIVILCDHHKEALARQISFVDEVITANLDGARLWSPQVQEMNDALRNLNFDLALCLGPDCSFRLFHLCGNSGAHVRLGFGRPGFDDLFNITIVQTNNHIFESDQYDTILNLMGLQKGHAVSWSFSQQDARQARLRYLDGEFSRGIIIGLDLSRSEAQAMTAGQFSNIVDEIIKRGAHVVIFFTFAEKKKVNYLKKKYGNRVLAFEQEDLVRVAALLEGCSVLVSGNTEVLHLAVSLKMLTIGIFYEDPQRWIPPNSKFVKVIQTNNLRSVTGSQVVQELDLLLEKKWPVVPV
tara:strand:+ start:1205 stop:2293 length:1089 start_codon:yes stop_codon:yes gene_type:complete